MLEGRLSPLFCISSDVFGRPRYEWHWNAIWNLVHNHHGVACGDEEEEMFVMETWTVYSGKWLFGNQRKFSKILLCQNRTPRGFASGEGKPGFLGTVPWPTSQPRCPASSPAGWRLAVSRVWLGNQQRVVDAWMLASCPCGWFLG